MSILINVFSLTNSSFKLKFILILILACVVGMLEVFSIGSLLLLFSQDTAEITLFDRVLQILNFNSDFQTKIIFFSLALLLSTILRFALISSSILLTTVFSMLISGQIFQSMISKISLSAISQRKDEYFSSIIGKVSIVANTVVLSLITIISNSIICIFILAYLLPTLSYPQIAGLVCFLLYLSLINFLLKGRVSRNSNIISKSYNFLSTNLRETNNALVELYLYQKLFEAYSKFTKLQQSLRNAQAENQILSSLPRLSIEGSISLALLVLGIFYLGRHTQLEPNDLIANIGVLAFVLVRTMPLLQNIQQSIIALNGNRQLATDLQDLVANSHIGEKIIESQDGSGVSEEVSSISVRNLSFAYNGKTVFDNLNFDIGDNKFLLLTGRSGSGKTTVLNILLGTEQDYKGTILFNQNDGKHMKANQIAQCFSYVPQRIQIFRGSLIFNVALTMDLDPERRLFALSCIEQAQIKASQISNNFNVEKSVIEDDGENLSGGQIQRIGIARALYQNRPFLVMDEPTSALDKSTEIKILETLVSLLKNNDAIKGLIFVSHSKIPENFCNDKISIGK